MKLADLTAGTEYLAASGTDWTTAEYRAKRIRVLSTDRLVSSVSRYAYRATKDALTMEITQDGTTYKATARKAAYGDRVDAVLAIYLNPKTGLVHDDATPKFVPLREIRGEWAPTYAAVVQRCEQIAASRRAAEKARTDGNARLVAATKTLEDMGVPMPHVGSWGTSVTMNAKTLEQIIALIG